MSCYYNSHLIILPYKLGQTNLGYRNRYEKEDGYVLRTFRFSTIPMQALAAPAGLFMALFKSFDTFAVRLPQFMWYLAMPQMFGFWVTRGAKMMSLCHGWSWQPHQTAPHTHHRHLKSVWAHWYAVHGHSVSALHSYTHPTWLRFWSSGSLVESKWCHYVTVEVDGHLKLLQASILSI